MRKIKSIKQLKAEKKLIKQRQETLENKIHVNWKELKEQLRPVNIAKDAIETALHKKILAVTDDGGFIKSTLSYGIALLAGKLAETAGEKFSKIFNRRAAKEGQADQTS